MPLRATPPPSGALLLRQYITRTGESVTSFCRHHGLDRVHIHRVLNGERRRICIDLADDIARATGGAVPIVSWRLRSPKDTPLMEARAA